MREIEDQGGDVGEAGWPLGDVENALCKGILQAERGPCHVDLNYVTHTEPPMLMLCAKRWLAEAPQSREERRP